MIFENAILLIGEISSGKSTLAKLLSNQLQMPIASFGGYLMHYCNENNIPENQRGNLQDLGQFMVDSDAKGFLKKVIAYSKLNVTNVIFEGVRHLVIIDAIKEISRNCIVVFVDATYQQRLERFLNRGKIIDQMRTEDNFLVASEHYVEREVRNLKHLSSYIITSSNSINADYAKLYEFIKTSLGY
ncbi:MAG: AAA family ATPase [Lacibacter sp.]|jgi:dephospho-CoA kinase